MKRNLPPRASLEHRKNQARQLFKAFKSGDPEAIGRIRESHPRLAKTAGTTAPRPRQNDPCASSPMARHSSSSSASASASFARSATARTS